MTEKEKYTLSILGVTISALLLIILLYSTIGFEDIFIKQKSDRFLFAWNNLDNKKINNLICESTDIKEKVDLIKENAGLLNSYSFSGLSDYKNEKKAVYSVKFNNLEDKNIKMNLVFLRERGIWKISNLEFDSSDIAFNKMTDSNYINVSLIEKNDYINEKNFAEAFIMNVVNGEFNKAYDKCSDGFKRKGSLNNFIEYVQFMARTYGKIEKYMFSQMKIGDDNEEIMIVYKLTTKTKQNEFYGRVFVRNNQITGFKILTDNW